VAGANGFLGEGGGAKSAPPPCATGQLHWCGPPPAMKAGEPAAHTYLAPTLARRARIVEKTREVRMAWRKAP